MSQHYPPPPGVDGRRSNASRHRGEPPAPPAYHQLPPPPSFGAPPPPSFAPQHSNQSNNQNSHTSTRFAVRDRDRDRDRPRDRDHGRDERDREWHRGNRELRDHRYPPRRNDNYAPPPRNLDSSYRNPRGETDSFRPPQGDFTFRANKPPGVGDSANSYHNSYRPSDQSASRGPPRGPANGPQTAGRGRGGRTGRPFMRRGGGGWKPFKPSDRALLQDSTGAHTTEDFADEENGPAFKALDQLSDSDEADMDMSDSDNQSGEPTAKRARTTTKPDDGDSAPKWSNPDPYTALPPLTDADKKKKDMVQMIRKARVETSGARTSLAAPRADQDFLRFDSDSNEASDDSEGFIDPVTYKRVPANAQPGATNTASSMLHPLPNKPASAAPSGSQVALQSVPDAANSKKQKILIDLTGPSVNPVTKRVNPLVDLTQSSDLGTRKRTHDDVLKLPSHAVLKASPRSPAGGKLASDWRATAKEPSCPWVQIATSQAHINIRLHMEVTDFYEHIKPRQFEERLRAKVVEDLNKVVILRLRGFNDCSMYPFGSYMSGLYLPTGDMDIAFCSRGYIHGGVQRAPSKSQIRKFADFVRSERLAVNNKVEGILHARVPLVKYVDKKTGLKMDISFENTSGIVATTTFKTWKEQWPVMPTLVTVIKQYLLMRALNEPVNGGIGGFSVICMVVSMLQNMPPVQSGDMDQRHDLGSLLMHFFDLYGNRFQHEDVALSLNPPGYIAKTRAKNFTYNKASTKISIIDPNNPSNDISGGSHNYQQIAASFSQAHKLLQERLHRIATGERFDSILEVVLGGNYSSFREQRDHLRKLHENIHGYCDE